MPAAHLEDGIAPGPVAEALAAELRLLAGWLGLEKVRVGSEGDLAGVLKAAVGVLCLNILRGSLRLAPQDDVASIGTTSS